MCAIFTFALAAVVLADPAKATFWIQNFASDHYTAIVLNLPDLDQRRILLPNNGQMYCVPTSAVNWAGYIANHGSPSLAPGPRPLALWQSSDPGAFLQNSMHVMNMGALMNTNSSSGTSPGNALNGLASWYGGQMIVYGQHANNGQPAKFDQLASFLRAGIPVIAIVGYYEKLGDAQGITFLSGRTGGHAMSLAFVSRNGETRFAGFRDPAAGSYVGLNNLATQSIFSTDTYSVSRELVHGGSVAVGLMDRVVGYGSGNELAYIDGFYAMFHPFVVTTPPTPEPPGQPQSFVQHQPSNFSWANPAISNQVTIPTLTTGIADIKPAVGSPDMFILGKPAEGGFSATVLYRYCPITENIDPVLSAPNARAFALNGNGQIGYLLVEGGNRIRVYDMLADPPTLISSAVPPFTISAMTFDDATQSLVALSVTAREVFRFNDLVAGGVIGRYAIDPSVPLVGDGSVSVNPLDGNILFTSTDGGGLYLMHLGIDDHQPPVTQLVDGSVNQIYGLSVDDKGDLFFSNNGAIRHFEIVGAYPNQLAHEVFGSPFAGMPAGQTFYMPRSRTNYDPAIHDGPGHQNVEPTEFVIGRPDCNTDLNRDGATNVTDLLMLLSNWGTCYGCMGDLNGDGAINVSDLLILLGDWGLCPE